MAEIKKRVPKRRFIGFSEDWVEKKLGEVCDMYNGDRGVNYPNDKDMILEGIPFINAGDIQNGRINLTASNKITQEKYNQLGGAKLCIGDIVYCLRGTLGKNALIDNFNEGTVASSLIALRPKNIDGKYLFYILNSNIELRQRVLNDEGAAQPNLSAKNLGNFDIPIPKRDEQKRISDHFQNLDSQITLQQRKLEKIKAMKKAYLSEMFPAAGQTKPKRRFKGFTEDWVVRKLEDGTVKIGDGLHGTPRYSKSGNVFFVNGNNFVNGNIFYTKDTKCVTEKDQSPDDKLLNENTILMSINGTIGSLAFYKGEKIMLGKSAAFITVRDFDKKFLYSYLQTSMINNYFMNSLTGTTIKNLGLKAIRETQIFVPDIKEQRAIGNFFSDLDTQITLHQKKLSKLQNLKKAYLNEMFI